MTIVLQFCVCVLFVSNSEQWHLKLFRRGRSHPAWVRCRVDSCMSYTRSCRLCLCFIIIIIIIIILFTFCKCVFVFFYFGLSMPIFFIAFFKNENFQQANKSTPCKPTCCIPLHYFRKIRVNCLKEKLKTLVHMIVFLKHDQLIKRDCLTETFTHALNFAVSFHSP